MHHDQEDTDAMKGRHAELLQEFLDAKKKADSDLPDFVTKPFTHRFVGDTMEMVAFNDQSTSDELFKFAKRVLAMAENKQFLERLEADAKRDGIPL